jgi:hypothetical protein
VQPLLHAGSRASRGVKVLVTEAFLCVLATAPGTPAAQAAVAASGAIRGSAQGCVRLAGTGCIFFSFLLVVAEGGLTLGLSSCVCWLHFVSFLLVVGGGGVIFLAFSSWSVYD